MIYESITVWMKLTYMLCLVFKKILGKMRCEQNKEKK